jgi:uncharacterized membrane protein
MATPASIAGHPIHPMLVVFPLGLWVFSLVSDLIFVLGGAAVWADVAYYTMGGGIVGALLAAVPGLIDYFAIRAPAVRATATSHMILNLAAVALYLLNLFFLRTPSPSALAVLLSAISVGLLAVSGWLGGSLVYVHGMGVSALEKSATERRERSSLAR